MSFKLAEDVIFLKKNNSQNLLNKIRQHKFVSSIIKDEIVIYKTNELNCNAVEEIINKYQHNISITFVLKNIDDIIRSEHQLRSLKVTLCIFTSVCAIIGTLIGSYLNNCS